MTALREVLRPCPFCGGTVSILFCGTFYVYCDGCDAEGPHVDHIDYETGHRLAGERWNQRTHGEAMEAVIEALNALVAECTINARAGNPASEYWQSIADARAALAAWDQKEGEQG